MLLSIVLNAQKEIIMSLNLVNLVNKGITSAFEQFDFALLKTRPLADENGEVHSYRATLVIANDRSTYTRSNGERVEQANVGETLQVTVGSKNVPAIKGMIVGVKLIKPQVHAVYATTAQDSTFASINLSVTAEDLILPGNGKEGGQ